ncbi:hypothetical protein [Xenorhabdus sp. PB30.3]|uniref:hypothetical protein n=1 Tax=Xenorhabdus sp. PB30.3 TaxID=2788941 RepID=UPI001E396B7C|nr:hypothetical protein [Xenorhabdus sp. PB30.3]MCC8379074.1 Rpn family recombination-promoting nuclease/putative transposase [Xenorhabdus sp. PB30.3]
MNIAQRLYEKGWKEGFKEGFEQGFKEGFKKASLNIARILLERGERIEMVMEITGLSREELITQQ